MSVALAYPMISWSDITVFRSAEDAEALWRALEAEGACTPYQRYDWLSAWYATVAMMNRLQTAIVVLHDSNGRPAALFPLVLERQGPALVARFAGGKHCNANMGVFRQGFAEQLGHTPAAAILNAMADEIAREGLGKVDVFHLRAQPGAWSGMPNPLAGGPGRHPAEDAHALTLRDEESDEALTRRLLGKDSRKKLAKKLRWLDELGGVAFRRAETEAEVDRVLCAFFRQKAERFRAQGIVNPFACTSTQAFLRRAALAGLDQGRPALEIHALWCGDMVAAAFGGCCDGRRLSGTFISFETDPAIMRSSPGELIALELARLALRRGMRSFDLGMGDDGYKRHTCPKREPRFESVVPVSALGRAVALGLIGMGRLKGAMKRDDRVLRTVRRVAFRLVGGGRAP
jgi:CelD/BcsL family acetyltransferase involved in cellulose biosynthesis